MICMAGTWIEYQDHLSSIEIPIWAAEGDILEHVRVRA